MEEYLVETISYTAARNNLAKTMDEVHDNHEPVLITRQKGPSVVMMSLEDFNAYEETAYLLRSPENARRLIQAQEDIGKTKIRERTLLDD